MDRRLKAAAYLTAEGRLRANAPPLSQPRPSEQLARLTREGTMFPACCQQPVTRAASDTDCMRPGTPINNPDSAGEEAQTYLTFTATSLLSLVSLLLTEETHGHASSRIVSGMLKYPKNNGCFKTQG